MAASRATRPTGWARGARGGENPDVELQYYEISNDPVCGVRRTIIHPIPSAVASGPVHRAASASHPRTSPVPDATRRDLDRYTRVTTARLSRSFDYISSLYRTELCVSSVRLTAAVKSGFRLPPTPDATRATHAATGDQAGGSGGTSRPAVRAGQAEAPRGGAAARSGRLWRTT